MASLKEDKASKAPTKMGQQSVCHFLKELVAVNMHTKFNTSQLDFGNGSALWYFHHSDISGFIFWVIAQLDVYSGVSMRTMKVLFQQCCNYGEIWEYILSQFTVELTGIIGIENRNREQGWKWQFETVFKIPARYDNKSLQLKSLIPSMCQILQHVHITLK